MIWPMLILVLANGSLCERNVLLASSVSDTVRMGATLASRFLNPKPFEFLSKGFRKLMEGNGRNDFVFVLLKLLGVDDRKVNDLAFNGIISAVSLMSQVLLKDDEKSRKGRNTPRGFSLFRFILTQPQVGDLIKQMEDPNLADLILNESKEKLKRFPEEKVQCVQLLICKIKPFVRGMQRSLRFFMKRENVPSSGTVNARGKRERENTFRGVSGMEETCGETEEETCEEGVAWKKGNLEDRMYFFVPELNEVIEEGDKCDLLFPKCVY